MEVSMSFIFGSRLVTNQSLIDYLKFVAPRFKAIELPTDQRLLNANFGFTSPEQQLIKNYQKRYHFKLTIHAPLFNLRLGALDSEIRNTSVAMLKQTIKDAAALNAQVVTFHPCILEPGQPEKYPENCAYEAENIANLLQLATSYGIKLAIENMPRVPEFHPHASDGTRLKELFALFPELGMTLDVGHALQAKVELDELLKLKQICHFHLHENDRISDRHFAIETNLPWWQELASQLATNFPNAIGIFEMSELEEQLTSYQNLADSLNRAKRAN